jgi:DNA-binding beta-propeller fold protein YncE
VIEHRHHKPLAALKAPECVRTTASGRTLKAVPAIKVPKTTGEPFGIAISSDGKAVFVVTDTAVEVYKASGGSLTFTGTSYPVGTSSRKATTAVVTEDGRYLLVASDNGIKVLDATAAEKGAKTAILGTLKVPGLTKYGRAVGVAVTPDDNFAFVSLQFRDQVGVLNLGKAIREQFDPSVDYYVGSLNVGAQPVGLTMSHDGATLYATAFVGNSAVPGILSVVDVVRATNSDTVAHAVVSKVTTGCFPARVAVSQDDKTVWVTARESNYLLGYSAAALRTKPSGALIAEVQVGSQPIGIALVNGGKRIVITDANNLTTPPAAGNLAIVDTAAALRRKPALVGYIAAAQTPHEMVLSPDGRTLYVTNYDGSEVQIIKVSTLP